MSAFRSLASLETRPIWSGIVARTVEGREMTFAVVELAPGAQAAMHQHANEQIGLVLEGSIAFTVAGETRELAPGDTYVIPGDTPHEATAGAGGAVVIDVFSPVRAEWQRLAPQPPSPPRWP